MNQTALKLLASLAVSDHELLTTRLTAIADKHDGRSGTWSDNARKFLRFLETGTPQFSVFQIGNQKLPFLKFSALPFVSCPGMGACSSFCYSIRAWRYPAAFFVQLQNTILLQSESGRAVIASELDKVLAKRAFRKLEKVDFRLYVDGDFDSMSTMGFWFDLISARPNLAAYGYSKSFELFKAYTGEFPENYVLNLSSGSKHDGDVEMLAYMESLPIVRGRFVALPIVGKFSAPKGDYKTKAYRDAVRISAESAGIGKVFVCPGKCGECTGAGHACGNPSLNLPIAIGIH